MKKYIILLFILGSMLFAEDKKPLFDFNAPKDWRPETIAFPLSFAPQIKYKGFEELRFAPGMFNPQKEDYFCYVFFFWMEENVDLDQKDIHKILLAYYKGLCEAVAEKRKLKLDIEKIKVTVKKIESKDNLRSKYSAVVDWYDPFVTGKELSLHMDIDFFHNDNKTKSILFACVSPDKPQPGHKTWSTMYKIRDSFKLKSLPKSSSTK